MNDPAFVALEVAIVMLAACGAALIVMGILGWTFEAILDAIDWLLWGHDEKKKREPAR